MIQCFETSVRPITSPFGLPWGPFQKSSELLRQQPYYYDSISELALAHYYHLPLGNHLGRTLLLLHEKRRPVRRAGLLGIWLYPLTVITSVGKISALVWQVSLIGLNENSGLVEMKSNSLFSASKPNPNISASHAFQHASLDSRHVSKILEC